MPDNQEPSVENELADLEVTMAANHPNSKIYKEAAARAEALRAEQEQSTTEEEPAKTREKPEAPKQATLLECIQMQQKQKELAREEAAAKKDS